MKQSARRVIEVIRTTDVPSEEGGNSFSLYSWQDHCPSHDSRNISILHAWVLFLSNFIILIEVEYQIVKYLSLFYNILARYNKETYWMCYKLIVRQLCAKHCPWGLVTIGLQLSSLNSISNTDKLNLDSLASGDYQLLRLPVGNFCFGGKFCLFDWVYLKSRIFYFLYLIAHCRLLPQVFFPPYWPEIKYRFPPLYKSRAFLWNLLLSWNS